MPQCQSVVVVRCEPGEGADAPPRPKERVQRFDERRRAPLDGVELDRIVIEADPIRPDLADVMSRAFAVRPTTGSRTFATGEGTQCTCMNRCPPFPFPCCDCSSPMDAYSRTPGGFSPLR